ncbi:MAG: ribonuclease N [Brachymonas sp.]|jgi:ribonuclease T1|nr:ribonuclease N [Brachymonas sp.]
MQSTPSFDAICSIQWAVQKLKRYSRWVLPFFGSVPLCLALLACKPIEAVAYKEADRAVVSARTTDAGPQPSYKAVEGGEANTVSLTALPVLEQRVYRLIFQGGPFPYSKDGTVFANRERLLPAKKRGFYREYTVAPPNASSRGPRRIVCGGPSRSPEVCYYTADHYASFQQIVP